MKEKTIIITTLIALAFIAPSVLGLSCATSLENAPQLPHLFNGTVYFTNGTAVPSNITVISELNSENFTIQTTTGGIYGTTTPFFVYTCGEASNKTIKFYLSGQATSNTSTYVPGATTANFNIIFSSSSPAYCGDGICTGGEVPGSDNVYPNCYRDCGSVAITISSVQATSITSSGATVTWTTNENSNSSLAISPSGTYSNSASSVTSHSIAITGLTASTVYTYNVTSCGAVGNCTSSTGNQFTTIAATAAAAAGGAAGGGGAAATTPAVSVALAEGNANITITTIAVGNTTNVTIAKTEDVAFRQINISVANAVNNIKIIITTLPDEPPSGTHEISGEVYHYIQIDKTNFTDSDISKVFIKFAVNKSWLIANGIDKTNISLYRWVNDKWVELPTIYLSEDSYEVFYQAESPGFSYFMIGTKGGEVAVTCTENWSCTGWSTCANSQQTRTCTDANACGTVASKPIESQTCIVKEEVGANMTLYYSATAIIIIIVIVVILFMFRKKISLISKKKQLN